MHLNAECCHFCLQPSIPIVSGGGAPLGPAFRRSPTPVRPEQGGARLRAGTGAASPRAVARGPGNSYVDQSFAPVLLGIWWTKVHISSTS